MRPYLLLLSLTIASTAVEPVTVAVNDYVGVGYEAEPVSFDLELPTPVAVDTIGIREQSSQVEILAGTAAAVERARIWTLVDLPLVDGTRTVLRDGKQVEVSARVPGTGAQRHRQLTLVADGSGPSGPARVQVGPPSEGFPLAEWSNGVIRVLVPVAGQVFDPPLPASSVPGPVAAIARGDEALVGHGSFVTAGRVARVECVHENGPVFAASRLVYHFADGGTYRVRVRLSPGKPFVTLDEDMDVGGRARFVFHYGDWPVDAFLRRGDQGKSAWESVTERNPTADFVRIAGQEYLARLVVWSQFNYFGGKQEIVALKSPDPSTLAAMNQAARARWQHEVERWEGNQAKWQVKPPRGGMPPRPEEPQPLAWKAVEHPIGNLPFATSLPVTAPGNATAVGAFYRRPDRWTRAKVNHVDLVLRPVVPGQPETWGETGLEGAVVRPALEAWIIDGHREWALFAVPAAADTWLRTAHLREGVWPLDRLNRLTLTWNADGSPVAPADTRPGDRPVAGTAAQVLLHTRGRSGLQVFNGSEGKLRGRSPSLGQWDGTPRATAVAGEVNGLVNRALDAYMSADDSAYPSLRAMLPWTHPEALNPFYQGMENMNFNADLYRYVYAAGVELLKLGHPEAERFLAHGEDSLDAALDRYVYPQSGCWEESHGYATHTIKTVTPLVSVVKALGRGDFFADQRFARMIDFFTHIHSPVDSRLGRRVVPPIGDHGLSVAGPSARLGGLLEPFAAAGGAVAGILGRAGWLVEEDGGFVPEDIEPQRPTFASTWLQGYGSVLRHRVEQPGVLVVHLPELAIKPARKKGEKLEQRQCDVTLTLPWRDGRPHDGVGVRIDGYNRASHRGEITVQVEDVGWRLMGTIQAQADRRTTGGWAELEVQIGPRMDGGFTVGYDATWHVDGETDRYQRTGDGSAQTRARESQVILRAGQSWGHHHADKGSLWFWGRNVAFCGDASWGGPPGGTYWNPYKQQAPSGTQIEFLGINNWTLPCKYPAPWISDQEYGETLDYARATCLYPFNRRADLTGSTPVALSNGYERQVLWLKPDVLVVRDSIESPGDTVWRLHSYQPVSGLDGGRAMLVAPEGVTADLALVHPPTASLEVHETIPDALPDGSVSAAAGEPFGATRMVRWIMPSGASDTWVLSVREGDGPASTIERLDQAGFVTRVIHPDGTTLIAFLASEPFTWEGAGWRFAGSVGAVVTRAGASTAHLVRGTVLETVE